MCFSVLHHPKTFKSIFQNATRPSTKFALTLHGAHDLKRSAVTSAQILRLGKWCDGFCFSNRTQKCHGTLY